MCHSFSARTGKHPINILQKFVFMGLLFVNNFLFRIDVFSFSDDQKEVIDYLYIKRMDYILQNVAKTGLFESEILTITEIKRFQM